MKSLAALALIITIFSCNQKEEPLQMVGAYAMTSQVLNDGTRDSVLDRKQLKIYTDKYMMYASPNIADSFANFGIGQYKVEDGKIMEYIFYRASDGEVKDSIELNIEQTYNGYKQVIDRMPIQGSFYKLTEEYDNVGANVKSPLDGAWRLIRQIQTAGNGDSTVNENRFEYKVFQSGYFIWAITVRDTANKSTSVFGYGRFEMDGDNRIKETIQNSTFVSSLIGKTYEVDLQFEGKDKYRQTITFANGEKSTEVYERLK
jgi:hypothetical protein